jgi:hypothetical protein
MMLSMPSKINKNKFNGVIFTPYIRAKLFGVADA